MLNKIYKYSLPVKETVVLELPIAAQIIRVSDIEGMFYLWAIVDCEQLVLESRYIEMYKTGQEFKPGAGQLKYLGECKLYIMQELGLYVFERVL